MLSGTDLRLTYADASATVHAVDGVTVGVGEREFVGLLGPSGSGKSSLLYLLAGLKRPTEGAVRFRDRSLNDLDPDGLAKIRREHFGFVFQNHFLINYLTGRENVGAALPPGSRPDIDGMLEELGVAHCRGRFPWQMSAGEKQRISIARAVAHRPSVVFADEPTASLDRPNATLVIDCLRRATAGGALLVVTHDESIVGGATRVLRMDAGRIV